MQAQITNSKTSMSAIARSQQFTAPTSAGCKKKPPETGRLFDACQIFWPVQNEHKKLSIMRTSVGIWYIKTSGVPALRLSGLRDKSRAG